MILTSAATADTGAGRTATLRGIVESGESGLEGYEVSLYAHFLDRVGRARVVGRATTGPSGEFSISYDLPHWLPRSLRPLLFVRAESGSAMLASALGQTPVTGPVVVNERTTVATGFAYAQFVNETGIDGNRYGMLNAAHMAANLAIPRPDDGCRAAPAAERRGRRRRFGPSTRSPTSSPPASPTRAAARRCSKRPPCRAGRRR